jgi:Tat protein translocase TatB subunit
MFQVGPGEAIAIFVLALIVLGPEKLPEVARNVGKVMGEVRRISHGFQQEIRTALEDDGEPAPTYTEQQSDDNVTIVREPLEYDSSLASDPEPAGAEAPRALESAPTPTAGEPLDQSSGPPPDPEPGVMLGKEPSPDRVDASDDSAA